MSRLKFYTLDEVAEITRQHVETVRKQVKAGEIAGTPMGTGRVRRRWLVSEDALQAFLRFRTEQAQPGPKSQSAGRAKPSREWV